MVRYTRPKQPTTAHRGLRPYRANGRDAFPSSLIEKMGKRIEKVLTSNGSLTSEENWLLAHVLLVARFREAPPLERNQILREINSHERLAHSLGFSTLEIRGINRLVLQKDQEGQLDTFIKEVEKRGE